MNSPAASQLERFPRVHGCVVSAGKDDQAQRFLAEVRETHPEIKLVLTGPVHVDDDVYDRHVETYAPDKLLEALRDLFPDSEAQARAIESGLEAEDL